jgi:DHA1 family multidrug resistance protein-like MFS transporter
LGDELVVPSVRGTFLALVLIGFFARLSYGMARTPLLSLFARALGGGPAFIGLVVRMSTVTGIFFKAPAGTLSDVYGRRAVMLVSVLIFGLMPFTYLIVDDYRLLTVIRFFHGFATAIYGPVAMAVIMDSAGHRKGSSWAPTPRRRPWADSLQRPSAAASSSSWGAPSPPLVSSAPST